MVDNCIEVVQLWTIVAILGLQAPDIGREVQVLQGKLHASLHLLPHAVALVLGESLEVEDDEVRDAPKGHGLLRPPSLLATRAVPHVVLGESLRRRELGETVLQGDLLPALVVFGVDKTIDRLVYINLLCFRGIQHFLNPFLRPVDTDQRSFFKHLHVSVVVNLFALVVVHPQPPQHKRLLQVGDLGLPIPQADVSPPVQLLDLLDQVRLEVSPDRPIHLVTERRMISILTWDGEEEWSSEHNSVDT
mmetsp:Transcript_13496/g.31068  ORF Transcript_13496/g.31068 Transcript_13496/m.31068 type:complete len:247 (+) Transcript_13496:193-933(+)